MAGERSGAAVEEHAQFAVAEQLFGALLAVAVGVGIVLDLQAVKVCRNWAAFPVLVRVSVSRLLILQTMIAAPGMSRQLFFAQAGRPAKD